MIMKITAAAIRSAIRKAQISTRTTIFPYFPLKILAYSLAGFRVVDNRDMIGTLPRSAFKFVSLARFFLDSENWQIHPPVPSWYLVAISSIRCRPCDIREVDHLYHPSWQRWPSDGPVRGWYLLSLLRWPVSSCRCGLNTWASVIDIYFFSISLELPSLTETVGYILHGILRWWMLHCP